MFYYVTELNFYTSHRVKLVMCILRMTRNSEGNVFICVLFQDRLRQYNIIGLAGLSPTMDQRFRFKLWI